MEILKIKPLNDQILVQPIEIESVFQDGKKTLCLYGDVLSIGKDVKDIKEGDRIIYEHWGLKSPEINDKTYHFIRESSIFLLGVVEK